MTQIEAIAEAPFSWGESLPDAREQAEREGKLVLLDFSSPT